MALNDATMQYLDDRGFVLATETQNGEPAKRVNRESLVARFGTALKAATCDDIDRVEGESKSVAEWREDILGDGDQDALIVHELNLLAGQLLPIGPNGPVQQYLEDGLVLCKTTVRRVDDDGVEHVKKGRGRIVSSDPDVIEKYHDAVKAAELIRKGQSTRKSFDLSGRRVPEFADRHQRMLTRTSSEIEQLLLLPADDVNGDGDDDSSEDES